MTANPTPSKMQGQYAQKIMAEFDLETLESVICYNLKTTLQARNLLLSEEFDGETLIRLYNHLKEISR